MTSAPSPLPPRAERLAALAERQPDVVVVGGGITGAGTALDLELRGLHTLLLERDDWAAATSSASSRLVHGGLRYLEHFELSLVRESCIERALLLRNAAGLVWPEDFLFPVRRGDRVGRTKMALGLWLYTALSLPRALGRPRSLSADAVARRLPGVERDGLLGGGSYLDGATDDARLALAVVLTAVERGAVALSRAEVRSVERGGAGAEVGFVDRLTGEEHSVRARAVVLAGGPFTEPLRKVAGLAGRWISPTRGSHVVVPRERLPTDGAVILSSAVDGRVMFLIPWPRHTVVGTTDLDADPMEPVVATRTEVDYLIDSANALVPDAGLGPADVVSTWAGLRPLLAAEDASPSARSREERVEEEGPIFTIAGGKLTGYRAMAEKLGARVARSTGRGLAARRSPTRGVALRGAAAERAARPAWSRAARGVPGDEARRWAWAKRYGPLGPLVAEVCRRAPDGEMALDAETVLGEVDWAVAHEDCLTAADFFLRRTDLAHGGARGERAARAAVLERMAQLGGWEADRRARETAELEAVLAGLDAWRGGAEATQEPVR